MAPVIAHSAVTLPSLLVLAGQAGETVSVTFSVASDALPVSFEADIGGEVTPNPLQASGQVMYSFSIPATAEPGDDITRTITATDESEDPPAFASVTIRVLEPDIPPMPGNTIERVSGNNQSGTSGAALNAPFVVRVLDDGGQPVPGISIAWSISPAAAGTLQSGGATTTVSDGRSSNLLNVIQDGRIRVTADAGDSGSVTFTVNGVAATPGLDPASQSVAQSVDTACASLEGISNPSAAQLDLLDTCDVVAGADAPEAMQVVQALVPDEVATQGTAAIDISSAQMTNISQRLGELRSGATGVSVAGLTSSFGGQTLSAGEIAEWIAGGGAGDEEEDPFGRWGVFINGNIGFGDRESTGTEPGFDFDTKGITAGVDYRFTDSFVLGAAAGYASTDADLDNEGGQMDVDGYSVSLFGTYYHEDQLYVDALASIGRNDYDTSRAIVFGNVNQDALADTDGDEYSFSVASGYNFNRNQWSFGPYGQLNYIRAEIDGYEEQASNPGAPGTGALLAIDDQSLQSLATALGAQVSYAISAGTGVFVPQVRVDWEHEFDDDTRLITGRFLADPMGDTFSVPTDDPDRDFFNVAVGLSATFARGLAGFIEYETVLGQSELEQHLFSTGVRIPF